jgi:hypothetical protein
MLQSDQDCAGQTVVNRRRTFAQQRMKIGLVAQ